MTFLDEEYDMTGTIFTAENLSFARNYLTKIIQKHDPSWLRKPTGYLANYWRGGGLSSVCYLVELSRILSTLDNNITKRSVVILEQKFKRFLRVRDELEYEALITELQVACMISERASPIAFHPLVPEELIGKNNEPPSPDFGIRLPGRDIAIEVTVFHLGILDEWDKSTNQLSNEISRILLKRLCRRIVYIALPISFQRTDLSKDAIEELCNEISSLGYGRKDLIRFNKTCHFDWEPMPHIVTDSSDLESFPNDFKYGTSGPKDAETMPAVAIATQPTDNFYHEDVVKSLRNTLNLKRKQFPYENPYLLIAKLGHHRLIVDGMVEILNERIWPNPDYGWMTGLAFFRPREQFEKNDNLPSLKFVFNPNARYKPSKALVALIEGRKTYHL